MANLKFTNPSTENTMKIDVDKGERYNTYAEYTIAPSATLAIDEADIQVPEYKALPDALRSGQLTVVEADMDSLTRMDVKNFMASGLDMHYQVSAGTLSNKDVVVKSSSLGTVSRVAVQGDMPTGVLRQDATAGQYVRVKTAGTASVVADGAIAVGDYLISKTNGKVIASATKGLWSIGVSGVTAGSSETLNIEIAIAQIP